MMAEAHQADPRRFPHLEGGAQGDERDGHPGQGAQHGRARGILADGRPDEGAQQHDDADDQRPDEPQLPGQDGVAGAQIGGQHDQKDHDEHVGHAGAVRHGRNVGAIFALDHAPGQIGVEQVAERQGQAQGGQNAAEHGVVRQVDHAQREAGQHQHVEQHIGEKAEKGVPVAGTHKRGRTSGIIVVAIHPPDMADGPGR